MKLVLAEMTPSELDTFITGGINIMYLTGVEQDITKFPVIRDGLFPIYTISKELVREYGNTVNTNALDFVSLSKRYYNR